MTTKHWNLLLLGSACLVWAGVFYTDLFAAFFWWVAPAVALGAISTAVLCSLLEAGPFARPLLALLPPVLITPYLAFSSFPDRAFGYLPLQLFLVPALAVSAIYLMIAVYRRIRPNNSFKPKPLRGSA
jgi:hypothetical protein